MIMDVHNEAIDARRTMVDKVAESLGVAALALDSGSLTPAQLRLIASGLREVRDELEDVSDALGTVVLADKGRLVSMG